MNSIRLKITIELNQNHVLTLRDLKAMNLLNERGSAACLHETIGVDTIRVTSVKETARSVDIAPTPAAGDAGCAPDLAALEEKIHKLPA